MKVRVSFKNWKWTIEEKKWWGWKTIFQTCYRRHIYQFIEFMETYRDLEIIRK